MMPESQEVKQNSLVGPGPRAADLLASANELWDYGASLTQRCSCPSTSPKSWELANREHWGGGGGGCSMTALITCDDLGH